MSKLLVEMFTPIRLGSINLRKGKTKDEMRILEVLFNGSSPISSAHTLEKYIDSTLRLDTPNRLFRFPKSSFGSINFNIATVCNKNNK